MHQVEWLKKAVFYNIYPQSYYDTNGDGVADTLKSLKEQGYVLATASSKPLHFICKPFHPTQIALPVRDLLLPQH